jgi:8-oxo-dGTP diphosphatase/2-hydroxy-dATP diphosphatase
MEMEDRPKKHLTLLFYIDITKERVLLGYKKRGFGQGKYNGFGGKLEPGESVLDGALREMEEESGLSVEVKRASYVGHIYFEFEEKEELMSVHILRAITNENDALDAIETEEMRPQWFNYSQEADPLPWNEMWIDDKYWLPYVLQGKVFQAHFLFRGHDEIVSHVIHEVDDSHSKDWTDEQLKKVLIPMDAPLQSSIDIDFGVFNSKDNIKN